MAHIYAFAAELWSYTEDTKICDAGMDVLPREGEEIELYADDPYLWFVWKVRHIKQDQETAKETVLKPRIYLIRKLKVPD